MTGDQTLVAAGGGALVLLNLWTSKDRTTISSGVFNSSATASQITAAHKLLIRYGGALLFVGVATLMAGVSKSAGTAFVAIIGGLFLVWAMNKYSPTTGKAS